VGALRGEAGLWLIASLVRLFRPSRGKLVQPCNRARNDSAQGDGSATAARPHARIPLCRPRDSDTPQR